MKFASALIQGTLIKRYKRFLADVELPDGQIVTAHCPNTGAMSGCAEPGFKVWLSPSDNPKRKLKYTWELAVTGEGHWIGINTHNANKLVKEALETKKIALLDGYSTLRSEVRYGSENSRIDFLLESEQRPDCYVEVKSVTLLDNGVGYFPDAPTTRGTKHMKELAGVVENGHNAAVIFCVQHSGIRSVSPARHIDPEYTEALLMARRAGVEIIAVSCSIDEKNISINQQLPIDLGKIG